MAVKNNTVKVLLYNLVLARKALNEIVCGDGDPRGIATGYFFATTCIAEGEANEFFATEDGKKLAREFGIK